MIPLVNEANLIAKELDRDIVFNTKLVRCMPEFDDISTEQKSIVKIQIDNNEDNYYYLWDCEKFKNRLYMIRELLNEYFDTNELPDFNDKEEDSFWDPPEPILIGNSYLSLKSLSYMLEFDLEVKIFTPEGSKGMRGLLNCRYAPCDAEGDSHNVPEELLVDEPEELLGREMYFKVQVHSCKDLPEELCKNVFVTYQMKHEPGIVYSTDVVEGQHRCPRILHEKVHHVDIITEHFMEYLDKGSISFKIFAVPDYKISKVDLKPIRKASIRYSSKGKAGT
jgi:hypothetical protein